MLSRDVNVFVTRNGKTEEVLLFDLTSTQFKQIVLLDAASNEDRARHSHHAFSIPGVGTKAIFVMSDPDYELDPNFSLESEEP